MTTPGMTFTQEGVLTKLTEKTAVLAERAFAPLFFSLGNGATVGLANEDASRKD